MLSKFFHAQWENPVKSDWVLDVKENLEEFQLPSRLEDIEALSTFQFKSLVKKRARKFELRRLLEIKEVKSKSKMKNLNYSDLKLQDYLLLKTNNISEAKALFKFRLRMAPFGENFRGGQKTIPCPLCNSHPDGQSESFQCIQLKKVINVKGDYNHKFSQFIPYDLSF